MTEDQQRQSHFLITNYYWEQWLNTKASYWLDHWSAASEAWYDWEELLKTLDTIFEKKGS